MGSRGLMGSALKNHVLTTCTTSFFLFPRVTNQSNDDEENLPFPMLSFPPLILFLSLNKTMDTQTNTISGASTEASHHLPPTQSQEKVPSAFAFSSLSPGAKGHSVKLECARRTESWDFLWGSCERLAIFRLAHSPG